MTNHGHTGCDDGSDTDPADEVDGDARFAQRPNNPRCAKPRAPPPDNTSPTPRRVRRRATQAEIGGLDDVVMQRHRQPVEPAGCRACLERSVVQQRKVDASAAFDRRVRDALRPWSAIGAGASHEQDHVGLAAALTRPTRLRGICYIHDKIVALLDARRTSRGGYWRTWRTIRCADGMLNSATNRVAISATSISSLLGTMTNTRAWSSTGLSIAAMQPACATPSYRDRKGGGRGGSGVENGVRQEQQLTVAQCHYGTAARLLQEPAGLADSSPPGISLSQPPLTICRHPARR